ncbi:hypothetical protein Taro_038703 [Colocasia esculenta]|uniref:Uncharacterized protein n=1 Tax=Colocasia esculenta TaxID=4460 RepID=A0A843WGL6_COLES|nr:hypothetical protein [Colocasia esculenta]
MVVVVMLVSRQAAESARPMSRQIARSKFDSTSPYSWRRRRARYSSTMMEMAPKRGVSRTRRHPNNTRYQFLRLAYEGTDEYRD